MTGDADDREADRIDEWLFGGLAALSAAVLTQLVERPTPLDSYLGACVLCFAVAIPLLVCSLLVAKATSAPRTKLRVVTDLAGVVIGVVGFLFLFLHVNVYAGVAFAAMVVFAFVLFLATARPRS
jgi:heme A synthase